MWLSLLASCAVAPEMPTAVATRGDLVVRLEVDGELKARRSVEVVNPLEGWSEIDFLVDEGERVEAGDVVLRFKTEDLLKELEEARSERDVAQTRVEQAQARLALQLGEARAKVVQAELDRKLAEFRQTDSLTVPRVDRAQARIAADQARITTEAADTHLAKVAADAGAEIEVLQLEVLRQERAIDKLEDKLARAEIVAPGPGVVLVLERWDGKYRVGTEVYQGASVLQLPDLGSLDVVSWVHEVDAPAVALGQQAQVTLDADPTQIVDAEVVEVAPIVVPHGDEGTKHLQVLLRLDESRPSMKPGMTTSVELVVGAHSDVVLVPSEAVFVDASGPLVRTADGAAVPVVVLGEDDEQAAVDGVDEGDAVLLVDPATWTGASP